MSWGHGAVQRTLLAELRKQQQAIDTMLLLRIICDGDDPTARLTSARGPEAHVGLPDLSSFNVRCGSWPFSNSGRGVKLSANILAGYRVLSAVGVCPPHDGVR
jgi:hypothetical protein